MFFALAMVVSPFLSSVPVLADSTEDTAIGDVTDPGILPDSGFYFMKKWGRSLQLMFAGSDAEKAKLMLKYSNEDALALQQMYQMAKYNAGSRFAEQYASQLENTVQTIEQVRTGQGENASEELVGKLEQNYLKQQEVLLSVLEEAPEAAQSGLLNAIENSNKHVAAMIMAQKGERALQQYQENVNQQTQNMGEETKIKVQKRLEVVHGQATQQGVTTQTRTRAQSDNQTSQQTGQQGGQQSMQQEGPQNMQNQDGQQPVTSSDNKTQGTSDKKQQGK